MKRLALTLFLTCMFALPSGAFAQDETDEARSADPLPTIEEVTKRLDGLYRSDASRAQMTMKVIKDRGTRTLTLESWSKGEDLSLIVIRKPAREAGTATLRTDEGLWNYAPRADRLIRIPAGLLSDAWMGSHFTNDDLVSESSYEDDFKTKLSWSKLDGEKVIRVEFIPRPDAPIVYTKIEYFIRKGDYVPIQANYYDEGKLMRRMQFSDVREVAGKSIPHKMVLTPMDKKGERTVVTYDELEFDVNLDDDLFTKRGLRRAAKRR